MNHVKPTFKELHIYCCMILFLVVEMQNVTLVTSFTFRNPKREILCLEISCFCECCIASNVVNKTTTEIDPEVNYSKFTQELKELFLCFIFVTLLYASYVLGCT